MLKACQASLLKVPIYFCLDLVQLCNMPSNSKFGFKILVGGKELTEYSHPEDSTRKMVESILISPVTYWMNIKEFSKYSEEIEEQKWPVTPYEIKVYAESGCPYSQFKVYVDGVQVKEVWLNRGESKIIEGFPDKNGSIHEFLFSLPRFAEDEKDRVETTRSLRVGKIEVICHEVAFSHKAMGYRHHSEKVDFVQANKKDVSNVTKNNYTMTTTRKGKKLRDSKPYERPSNGEKTMQTYYNIGDEVGKLHLEYHMTHTLIDWGIKPVRPQWTTS